jgi:hypothetical protein
MSSKILAAGTKYSWKLWGYIYYICTYNEDLDGTRDVHRGSDRRSQVEQYADSAAKFGTKITGYHIIWPTTAKERRDNEGIREKGHTRAQLHSLRSQREKLRWEKSAKRGDKVGYIIYHGTADEHHQERLDDSRGAHNPAIRGDVYIIYGHLPQTDKEENTKDILHAWQINPDNSAHLSRL